MNERRTILIVAAIGLAVGAVSMLLPRRSPDCTGDVIESQTILAQRKQSLGAALSAGAQRECSARRDYVNALSPAVVVANRCGPPQMTRASASISSEAEASFQRRLLAERCL